MNFMTDLYNKDNTYYQLSGDSYDNKKNNLNISERMRFMRIVVMFL